MSRVVLVAVTAGLVLAALPTYAQQGPFQFHSLTPCRLVDTRLTGTTPPPTGGPILTTDVTRTFPIQGLCSVPVGAKAVSLNLTIVRPNGAGHLTVWPTGITKPVVSSVNFIAGEPAIANGAIVPLADQSSYPQDLSVYPYVAVTGGTVHLVIDVTGYFQ
jgi:hypothetical protein